MNDQEINFTNHHPTPEFFKMVDNEVLDVIAPIEDIEETERQESYIDRLINKFIPNPPHASI